MSRAVATIGMFDGVHLGHRDLLRHLVDEAKSRDCISFVITFANHPLSIIKPELAPKLISSPEEKRKLLFDCGVDTVSILDFTSKLRNLTARDYMRKLKADYDVDTIILGFNNRFGSDISFTFDDYVSIGAEEGVSFLREPEYLVEGENVNSSIIRSCLLDSDINKANRLLGYNFTLSGNVVYGKQLGRTIGFPTANIGINFADKLIPGKGVYACYVTLKGGLKYPAMVNIGHRPTIDGGQSPISIEAHIIGISQKLYGERISLSFVKYLRNERTFNSIEELKAQLEIDKVNTMNLLAF